MTFQKGTHKKCDENLFGKLFEVMKSIYTSIEHYYFIVGFSIFSAIRKRTRKEEYFHYNYL